MYEFFFSKQVLLYIYIKEGIFVLQVYWLRVGVMVEIVEELISGYVYQIDREGIMVVWDVEDYQFGIVKYKLVVGIILGYYFSLMFRNQIFIEIRINFKEIVFGNYLIFQEELMY